MLDTNAVSALLKQKPEIRKNVTSKPLNSICISAITEAEMMFGLAQRPELIELRNLVYEFLVHVDSLPWESQQARVYGELRAELKKKNITIAPMDLLIAAHAYSLGAVLVTSDKAFSRIDGLMVEDWNAE